MTPAELKKLTEKGKADQQTREEQCRKRLAEEERLLRAELVERARPYLKNFRDQARRTAEGGYNLVKVMEVAPNEYDGPFGNWYQVDPKKLKGVAAYVYATLVAEGFDVGLIMDNHRCMDGYEWEWSHRLNMEASW